MDFVECAAFVRWLEQYKPEEIMRLAKEYSKRQHQNAAPQIGAEKLSEGSGQENRNSIDPCQSAVAAKDAARYRWLRARAWPFTFNGDTPESADAAIDEAMENDQQAL